MGHEDDRAAVIRGRTLDGPHEGQVADPWFTRTSRCRDRIDHDYAAAPLGLVLGPLGELFQGLGAEHVGGGEVPGEAFQRRRMLPHQRAGLVAIRGDPIRVCDASRAAYLSQGMGRESNN